MIYTGLGIRIRFYSSNRDKLMSDFYTFTKEEIVKVFTLWEENVRKNPDGFSPAEEMRQRPLDELAKSSAETFLKLANK